MFSFRRALFALSILSVLAAGCAAPATPTPAAPTAVPAAPTMAAAKPTDIPAPTTAPTMAPMKMEATAAPIMDSSMSGMSGMGDMSMATDGSYSPFKVSVAQYFLDSAGFHGMATTLSNTQKIDPTYLSTVTRVTKVLSQTTWPAGLNDQGQEFLGSLNTFAAALTADDAPAAIEASDVVHDAQHELSHAIDHTLSMASAPSGDADPFQVSVAQYFMDAAGFHGMAETLSDTQKIDPAYRSTVTRVTKILSQTTWPADLNDQAQEFLVSLNTFAAALAADDTPAAIEASDVVHDAQHELSHGIDHWLSDAPMMAMAADPFNVRVAQYFLDTAGFHGMATTLSDTQKIDATYLGKVTRVAKVLKQTTWPADLNDQAQSFIKSLDDFAAALTADDTQAAIETSDVVHDAQHELSHAIDHWLAEMVAMGPMITVDQVWAMPSSAEMGASNSAFYLVIKNSGMVPDQLIGAKTDACGLIELDDMIMANGQMEMKKIEGQAITVPANGSVELKPGGMHVMCMQKLVDFKLGGKVPLTLVFEKSGEVPVMADIREP